MLVTFLQANLDVFVWQISDMSGIPREVIEHMLGLIQCTSRSSRRRGDTHQRAVKPFDKKSIT
jgi:hypothetical protein